MHVVGMRTIAHAFSVVNYYSGNVHIIAHLIAAT